MTKQTIALVSLAVVALTAAIVGTAEARGGGSRPRPVVYVTSQGLFYDSIITADPIPPQGEFQLLEMGPFGLQTEFGPTDPGYLGGRWKADFDEDGEFHYFMCPLLPPGRPIP